MKAVRFAVTLLLFLLSPIFLLLAIATLGVVDLCFLIAGKKRLRPPVRCRADCASVVIPNWNGRDLLEKYLPSVIAALSGYPGNEVIVVDNASSDGSAEFVKTHFPEVRLIECTSNLGFGGGSNLGIKEANNDIVVLLNSDMRVERGFLAPLLQPFHDPLVFAVACQIFFSDPAKRREETGLTQGWWANGRIRVSHRVDNEVIRPFPCFYAGGGSSAYDRRKFLELGGFDEVLKPFYYEDTDLGVMAWKRGWKVLYQPASVVYHEHRGTIGRKFSAQYVQSVLKKNSLLFIWKNIHSWRLLATHFPYVFLSCLKNLFFGDAPQSFNSLGLARACLQLPELCKARWHARKRAAIAEKEAFLRPLGLYFRDRFEAPNEPVPKRLRVLFVSPYAIEPPVHGGAISMKTTLEELAPLADIHLACMVDNKDQLDPQLSLLRLCRSVDTKVRVSRIRASVSSLLPHAVREFRDADFAWMLHRIGLQAKIDVLQLEYTQFAQYRGNFRHIPCFLFEHDIHFESVYSTARNSRRLRQKLHYYYEYLRCFRYELTELPKFTRVQVCTSENAALVAGYLPDFASRLDDGFRAGIQTERFNCILAGREPDTMLFIGSFRHAPNAEGIKWFVEKAFPHILAVRPTAKLVIVGSEPPPSMKFLSDHPNIRFTGFVSDIKEPLERYAIFVCPILSGSGIRMKLQEAFASGIPSVSTRLGAEGLARESGTVCELGDSPEEFAAAAVRLLSDPEHAMSMARRARQQIEIERDGPVITRRMVAMYRREVEAVRPSPSPEPSPISTMEVGSNR